MFVSARTRGHAVSSIHFDKSRQEKQVKWSVMMPGNSEWLSDTAPAPTPATARQRRDDRIRSWRRRILLRRGARIHAAMGLRAQHCSVAMLDETGIVVSWHGELGAGRRTGEDIVNRHVSQFYIPEDIGSNQPQRDLRSATIEGSNIRQGWRRQADGTTYWGSVLIEAVVLRDGRLQGFSFVISACDGPAADVPVPQSLRFRQGEEMSGSSAEMLPLRFRLPRDRMVRSRDAARQRRLSRLAPALLVLSLWASLPTAAEASDWPEHARASRYGGGWECVSGFRRIGNSCVTIVVPANAYLDAAGSGWRCNRGYVNVREACVAVKVPQNAYLDDSYGQGWRCDHGYREANGVCAAVSIPMNAHGSGSSYGSGWECNRGFRQADAECVAVVVPAQGYLTRSGDNWECERGFMRKDSACITVQPPANAHLDYSGNGWSCDEGFHKHAVTCVQD
jgi:hypothetical protein